MRCFALYDGRTRTYEDGDNGSRDHNRAELFDAAEADQRATESSSIAIVPIVPFKRGKARPR